MSWQLHCAGADRKRRIRPSCEASGPLGHRLDGVAARADKLKEWLEFRLACRCRINT
jgi:hypothetical protein